MSDLKSLLSSKYKYLYKDSKGPAFLKIYIPKGFSFGVDWLIAFLAASSHIFIDIRFEPYGFAYYPTNVKVILSVFYGIVMGGGFWIAHILIRNRFKYWELYKEIVWSVATVFIITNINFFFRFFSFKYIFHIDNLFPIAYWRYMLVGVEVAGTTALVFKLFQIVLVKAGMFDVGFPKFRDAKKSLFTKIYDNEGQFLIDLNVDRLIYVESEGNYVKLYFDSKFETLRVSLICLEEQLRRFPQVKRVQKSYLANFDHTFTLEGNARKAYLRYSAEIQVPISRSFYKEYKV